MSASPFSLEIAQIAATAADAKQAENLFALDVSEPLALADVFLLASGRNELHVRAIAEEIIDRLRDSGVSLIRREGLTEGRWVLLDFGDLIVHVFHHEERTYYSLERLWKDCPEVVLLGAPVSL